MKNDFYQSFSAPSIVSLLRALRRMPASHWDKKGREMALRLFQFAARAVPAYRALLHEKRINPLEIATVNDLKRAPFIDKQTYLRAHELEDLLPHRDVSRITTFAATSGSTGEPFYLPRGEAQDEQYEYIAELFLRTCFGVNARVKTLGIIGFALGIWIGGIFTYKNFNRIAGRGLNLSLMPIGVDKALFLKSLKRMGHLYDQVILMGYPPFIKDIVDEAEEYGINWSKYRVKIFTATEGFSEKFREYLVRHAAIKNPLTDILNVYGSVELGTMAHETPLTTLIRRIAVKNQKVFKALFGGAGRLPTLAQYHPYLTYFEEVDGELAGTGYGSSIPFVRYRFHDRGGVIPFEDMAARLASLGIDMIKEARAARIEKTVMKLPFVYVYERADSAASLVGILIYPEYLKDALAHRSVSRFVTGKFTMETKTDRRENQFLEVNVECSHGVEGTPQLRGLLEARMVKSLLSRSTEYKHLYSHGTSAYRKRLIPKVVLWPHGDSKYFKLAIKQKWVKK